MMKLLAGVEPSTSEEDEKVVKKGQVHINNNSHENQASSKDTKDATKPLVKETKVDPRRGWKVAAESCCRTMGEMKGMSRCDPLTGFPFLRGPPEKDPLLVMIFISVIAILSIFIQVRHDYPKKLQGSPYKDNVSFEEEEKMRQLLPIHEAPEYLQHNPFILHGYRGYLTTKLCIESVFWWTNETINIWSHIFGWMLFVGLTLYDLFLLNIHAPFGDKMIVALLLVCFQACMILSSVYHTFSCRSEKDYWCFLSFDLFGIALSLLAIYMSGVYYAFWCHTDLQQFYLITVLLIFIFAMILQLPSLSVNENVKLLVFVAWAAYGVLPTLHWSIAMGGMENPMVNMLLPRVLGMYTISGAAFIIYLSKVPERFFPGWVDYVGSSHQWWHALVVLALYYWHNTGMLYVEYRMNHGCPSNMRL